MNNLGACAHQKRLRSVAVFFLLLTATLFACRINAETPTQRVGLPLLLKELYLEGPLLEPTPRRTREVPLIVRIAEVKPAQDGFHYTIEVQGLAPGTYNLGKYLRPAHDESGTSTHDIPLTIITELPPGLPEPTTLAPKSAPRIGGYRTLLWLLGLAWVAGLTWIVFFRKQSEKVDYETTPEPTLAERLKPLLQHAAQGNLPTDEQARLERLILAHWRQRIPEVEGLPTAESLTFLREHPEASPLLLKLEFWLHAPESKISSEEIENLLKPYRT